jgi:hypothetical protein
MTLRGEEGGGPRPNIIIFPELDSLEVLGVGYPEPSRLI